MTTRACISFFLTVVGAVVGTSGGAHAGDILVPLEHASIQAAIVADGAGSTVSFRSGEGADSILRGFTLTGGSGTALDGGGTASSVGGGVLILATSPRIECCTIRGNHAPGGGGGIFAGPDPGAPGSSGLPVFQACVIEVNSTGESGGGLLNLYQGVDLADCLVRANVAAGSGGGIAQAPGSVGLAGTTLKGNVAGLLGGGARPAGSRPPTACVA